jgi:hypothetical protein
MFRENQPQETIRESQKADELIELKNPITPIDKFASYHIRNQYMVDQPGVKKIYGFWNGQYRSGTTACMNYARKQGKKVREVRINGID